MSTNSTFINLGSSLTSPILLKIFPFLPRTRCWVLSVTGSVLFKCSYRHLWSRLRCFSVRWCLRISIVPLLRMEKFFLQIWHQTIYGLWIGSAGPEMKDRVHPILAKNSSRIATPRWGCPLAFGVFLDWDLVLDFSVCSFTSDKVISWLLRSVSWLPCCVTPGWVVGETIWIGALKVAEIRAISPAISLSSNKEESPRSP